MNKKTGIAAGLVLLIAAMAVGRFKDQTPKGATSVSATPTPAPGFGQYLKQPHPSYHAQLDQDSKIPKACLDYFDSLQKIDFVGNDTQEMTYQMLPQAPEGCAGEFVKGFTAAQQDYLKKCSPKENMSDKISEDCISAVFLMRAGVTRIALGKKPLAEISDLSQLTDLVFSELSGAYSENSTPDFNQMKAIAERMLEVNPNLYAAHKVNVMSNMMEAFMTKDQNPSGSNEAWARTGEALAKAHELRPDDDSLADADLAVQTRGFDPVATLDLSKQMTAEDPQDDRGWYLMAFAQWKQGDHTSAIANLKQAIALAPEDEDYQKILQEISQPNASGDSFKGALTIGISNDDFNH